MRTNLTVEIVNVTPELAANYLKFNSANRVPSKSNYKFLVQEMISGRFLENGEAIIFDKYGDLKDGQHRLLAIVKTGLSYNIPIVRGVEPVAMSTYDTGKNRSAGDVLSLNGFKNTTGIASLILAINNYEGKKSKKADLHSGGNRELKLTNQQVLEHCKENYEWLRNIVLKSASIYARQTSPKIFTQTQIGIIAYMIGGENPSKNVYDFLNYVVGISRTADSATTYLFTKLYNSKVNREPLNFYWILGMTIKAYNYFIEGNPPVKYYKFTVDQDLPKVNKELVYA